MRVRTIWVSLRGGGASVHGVNLRPFGPNSFKNFWLIFCISEVQSVHYKSFHDVKCEARDLWAFVRLFKLPARERRASWKPRTRHNVEQMLAVIYLAYIDSRTVPVYKCQKENSPSAVLLITCSATLSAKALLSFPTYCDLRKIGARAPYIVEARTYTKIDLQNTTTKA